jgi:hypothetical protein
MTPFQYEVVLSQESYRDAKRRGLIKEESDGTEKMLGCRVIVGGPREQPQGVRKVDDVGSNGGDGNADGAADGDAGSLEREEQDLEAAGGDGGD